MTLNEAARKFEHHALNAEMHLEANDGKPPPERVAMAQAHASLAVGYAMMLKAAAS